MSEETTKVMECMEVWFRQRQSGFATNERMTTFGPASQTVGGITFGITAIFGGGDRAASGCWNPLREKWWREKDSNLRRRMPVDLQSTPFGHFGISPADQPERGTVVDAEMDCQAGRGKAFALISVKRPNHAFGWVMTDTSPRT